MQRPKIGLALSSGVGRGWAHIGVLQALADAGYEYDVIAGTSIGALVAGAHLGGHLDTLEKWARKLNRIRIMRYLDITMAQGGIMAGRRLTRILYDNLGGMQIEDLPKPFAIAATELETGHEIWLRRGPLVEALRASYAMPGIFPPVELDGRRLVDGALVNPVPVSLCRAMGARLVVAVNLNGDILGRGYRRDKKPAKVSNGSLLDNLFARDGREDQPGLFHVMAGSLNILQDRLARSRLAGDPPDVSITPRVGHIGLLEFDRAGELIEEGRLAVEQAKPFLDEALAILGE
jgi:NTE family protein